MYKLDDVSCLNTYIQFRPPPLSVFQTSIENCYSSYVPLLQQTTYK